MLRGYSAYKKHVALTPRSTIGDMADKNKAVIYGTLFKASW